MLGRKRDGLWQRDLLRALVCGGLLFACAAVSAAPLDFVPQRILQPDGIVVECFASGDEFYNWLHDKDGFTIMQDPANGFYVYALKVRDKLVPSTAVAGRTDPRSLGVEPWVKDSPEIIRSRRTQILRAPGAPMGMAPTTGTINNIVVFIRFADETEFTDPVSAYASMFNANTPGTNSLYNYFREVSYSRLSVLSTFYPLSGTTVVSYQDTLPRAYYQPYNATTNPTGYQDAERTNREQYLLVRAVKSIAAQVPANLVIDSDNDGAVDNLCFIVKGTTTAWSTLLWPHRWALFIANVSINGKQVWDYNFQLQQSIYPGVLAHEMFHTLGSPDLYHYTKGGTPVGGWDLMATNTDPPIHMGAYMKYRYAGWISSLPTISSPGRYELKSATSPTGNCYKIPSPFSSKEFFVVEYRKKGSIFESKLPGEGLLVYRIDGTLDGIGNADGPPDEVYVYRQGGTPASDGSLSKAPFSKESGRSGINDITDPFSFLANGFAGGLNITNVGARGDTISFVVEQPLPAAIDSFWVSRLTGDSVRVQWTTLSEYRLRGFEIHRSLTDTTGYHNISGALVLAHGTSNQVWSYSYVDPANGSERFYRIMAADSSGNAMFSQTAAVPPVMDVRGTPRNEFALLQNYPNPFNPTSTIQFTVDRPGSATLTLYDVLGQKVATLFEGRAEVGRAYSVTVDGRSLASGVYVYVLDHEGRRDVKRLMLLR